MISKHPCVSLCVHVCVHADADQRGGVALHCDAGPSSRHLPRFLADGLGARGQRHRHGYGRGGTGTECKFAMDFDFQAFY